MAIAFEPQPVPLATDESGIVRVSGTRVTLDTIVNAFQAGETPEQIAQNYDSVPLEDIYQVIGYYLSHQDAVDSYLREGKAASATVRAENERRYPTAGIRERLLARRQSNPATPGTAT
jgi:uncharacterized protein (DUF433 family)